MVKTQLCKLRDASDTLIGRACDMFHLQLAFVSYMYDIVVGTQFHKFYGRRSRVFNIDMFLMKCIFTGQ